MKKREKITKRGYILLGLLFAVWTYFAFILAIQNVSTGSILFLLVAVFISIGFLSQGWLFNQINLYIVKPFIKWILKIFWKSSIGILIKQVEAQNIEEKESGKYRLSDINMSTTGSVIAFIISIIFLIIIYPKWQNDELIHWYEFLGVSIWTLTLLGVAEEEEGGSVTKFRYYIGLFANFILKSLKWIVLAIIAGLLISWVVGLPPTTIIIILLLLILFNKNS
jgi:hypothetical protein